MPTIHQLIAHINLPTALAAAALVILIIVVIRIGKVLVMAAIFGAVAGGASLSQGNPPGTAGTHAAIGFGAAAVMMFLIRFTKSLLLWLVITAAGVAALLAYGFARR
jgi:hypothetical protein